MGRLSKLRAHVNYELELIPALKTRTVAIVHLCGVSLAAAMIAKKWGRRAEKAGRHAVA